MLKKKNLLVILLLLIAFVCVGCGSKKKGKVNFEVPEGGYDGSDVTINFYHTMGSNLSDVLDAYIVEFNKLYPNIHVVSSKIGGYNDVRDQISTEITEGNQPNIAYCYPDHVALYNLAGAVATLDSLIESKESDGNGGILGLTQEQINDFIEGYYAEGTSFGDGLMYTMPFSKSTEVLYYNKTFFEANNLTIPTTWDEMEALCEKIKKIDPNCIPLGYDSSANWFITMCEQYMADGQNTAYTSATGEHYLFNTELNRSFVKKFQEWYKKGYITTQTIYGAYTSGLFVNTKQGEGELRSYMSIGSSAGATHQRPTKENGEYPFEVGIATIPQVNPSKPKVISQGPSVCIFKKANPQEVVASWLFVKYLTTSVEFQAEFSIASGYVPVIKSVVNNAYFAKTLENADGGDYVSALSTKICMEQVDAYFVSPAFVGSSTARDEVGGIIDKSLVSTDADIEAAILRIFQDAIAECEYNS